MDKRISQEFINELVSRVDIVEIIGAQVVLQKRGRDYLGLCPFHNEKTPSFSVSQQKQFYYCFGCGEGGTALSFLLNNDNMRFMEAIELLAAKTGMEIPKTIHTKPTIDYRPLYDVLAQACRWFMQQLPRSIEAKDYIQTRKLTVNTVERFNIGFAPPGWDNLLTYLQESTAIAQLLSAGLIQVREGQKSYDRFRQRIIFPVRDVRGRVIAFGGRAIHAKDEPKYLNSPTSPIFAKGQHLYGLYEAIAHKPLQRLFFVEGYMDVLALEQAGIPGAVASMGTAVTEQQLKLAFRYAEELVFCFDGDSAGQKAAWRTLQRVLPVLDDRYQIKFMFLPQGMDPDDLVCAEGKEGFLAQAAQAASLVTYLFDQLQKDIDVSSIDGRSRLAAHAVPLISTVKGTILKQLLRKQLQNITGFSATARTAHVAIISKRDRQPKSLVQKILHHVLLAPSVVTSVNTEDTAWLCHLEDSNAMLLDQIVRQLKATPTGKAAVLLAVLADHPEYKELVKLCDTDLHLDLADRKQEFQSGWHQLQGVAQRLQQKRFQAQIKAEHPDPTSDILAELVARSKEPGTKVENDDQKQWR